MAATRKEFVPVNNPQLLPEQVVPVVDVAGFLSKGQIDRLTRLVRSPPP